MEINEFSDIRLPYDTTRVSKAQRSGASPASPKLGLETSSHWKIQNNLLQNNAINRHAHGLLSLAVSTPEAMRTVREAAMHFQGPG